MKAVSFSELSWDQKRDEIRVAFRLAFPEVEGQDYLYLREVYDNYVIVERGGLTNGTSWRVAWSLQDGAVAFAAPEQWEAVVMTFTAIKAVPGADWELDVLAAPFGGPINGRDLQGEYFDTGTEFHADKWPLPPVVYYHGLDPNTRRPAGKAEYIGQTLKRWVDGAGVWFRVKLDQANAYAQRVWEAAQKGAARASSGTIAHLARVDPNGHITDWPLVELSLLDAAGLRQPINPYAVAMPVVKAVYQRAGLSLPEGIDVPEAAPQAGGPAAAVVSATDVLPTTRNTGDVEMADASEIKAAVAEGVAEGMKAAMAGLQDVAALKAQVTELTNALNALKQQPPATGGGHVTDVHDNEAERPFASLGEQLQAVANVAVKGQVDRRLLALNAAAFKAAAGMSEAIPSDGGFAVQQDFASTILTKVYDDGQILSRVTPIPLGPNSNGIKLTVVDETSRVEGSRYGGVVGYWAHEADTVTAGKIKLGRVAFELEKLFALMYVTDELLADAPALIALAQRIVPRELRFKAERACLRGTGAGEPLGAHVAACCVQVAKETGQAADTIVKENIDKMWSRMWASSWANAVWHINQDCLPQLDNLSMVIGTAGVPVYLPPNGLSESPYGRLKGRPVIPLEFSPTVGDAGDISLCDWTEYLTIAKEIAAASSIHVKFTTDEMTFRWVWRLNGQPAWKSALTPESGNANQTLSPFVKLAVRA